MRTNCKNCGAPLEAGRNKCAYCGTSYYDLSCIPIGKPFYLTVNVGSDEKPQLITARVFAKNIDVRTEPNILAISDLKDGTQTSIFSLDRSIEMNFQVMEDFK